MRSKYLLLGLNKASPVLVLDQVCLINQSYNGIITVYKPNCLLTSLDLGRLPTPHPYFGLNFIIPITFFLEFQQLVQVESRPDGQGPQKKHFEMLPYPYREDPILYWTMSVQCYCIVLYYE